MLDIAGYTSDRPLYNLSILEPSFGGGDFLFQIIERLFESWKATSHPDESLTALQNCICAIEVNEEAFHQTSEQITSNLRALGASDVDAAYLATSWLKKKDFLLVDFDRHFDFVIGNPPYVRQELISETLLAEYKRRFSTIYDRADLYVPFIEHSLDLLLPSGVLVFICSDRWMKNKYGGPLRSLIASDFHLKIYIDMYGTAAFKSEVFAYTAITALSRRVGLDTRMTRVAWKPVIDAPSLKELSGQLLAATNTECLQSEYPDVAIGREPWILHSSLELSLVRRLESVFPTLEGARCKVGIGVATGADSAFIGIFDSLDVEDDRKLPLATTGDILSGKVAWRGLGVINPFLDQGGLVDLAQFPKLESYLMARRSTIASRHIAKKNNAAWYRTIDRIYPGLAKIKKLLIPDIKGSASIVFEGGMLYPHHNLYYIISDEWDLRVLQGILISGIARFFVSAYTTKMHGGYLRFQAQYLRRIRLPNYSQVSVADRAALIVAGETGNAEAALRSVMTVYGLSRGEAELIAAHQTVS